MSLGDDSKNESQNHQISYIFITSQYINKSTTYKSTDIANFPGMNFQSKKSLITITFHLNVDL